MRLWCLTYTLLAVLGCQKLPDSSVLPPVAAGNVTVVPEDEGPIGKSSSGTFRLITPPGEQTNIEYSGQSN